MSVVLNCQNVSHSFGERKLFSNLSFEVHAHDFWVITGPSGVGKSTLIRILTKELEPDSGNIQQLVRPAEVPQNLYISPGLTAKETIATGDLVRFPWWETLFNFPGSSLLKAEQLCDQLQISNVSGLDVDRLSGGERQRVALGRALIQQSKLLIADEPISMLDEKLADDLLNWLSQDSKNAKLFILHQHELVQKFATHVLNIDPLLKNGWNIVVRDRL